MCIEMKEEEMEAREEMGGGGGREGTKILEN